MAFKNPAWLEHAVFYQIYPQSFYDSNGDGIGDVPGITAKLDYIEALGANAIWINPCFESPFADAGYDISNFYKVASRYGTISDLKKLFKAAHKKGIRVILDLVAGHTSIEHPWFKASCRHRQNKYSNWYIWSDWWTGFDEKSRMVHGYGQRSGNYVTNFFYFQPALNYGYANPDPAKPWQLPIDHPDVLAVREELKKIMRYWLDMGCDGFRVDMASSLVKNDPDWKYTGQFWKQVRSMLDKDYPEAILIAEWFYPQAAIDAGFHIDFMANGKDNQAKAYSSLFRMEKNRTLYNGGGNSFFDKNGQGDISVFMNRYIEHYQATRGRGYISLYSGNHDITRISIGRTTDELELIFAFLLTMPGVPFIYYGDEIAMKYKRLESKEGGYHRTGSRTPMQWSKENNAGFSQGRTQDLYLPVEKSANNTNIAAQLSNCYSLLNRVRKLIDLRKAQIALGADGKFECVYCKKGAYPLVYCRAKNSSTYLIVINPAGRDEEIRITNSFDAAFANMVAGRGVMVDFTKRQVLITASPVSYAIFKLSK
ncbi:MAG: glycosylase [Planctomycetes bacterium GWF2_50_10]|nr:MAG: glycosylase [Planctomycetes bacterium GWF2_50_10]